MDEREISEGIITGVERWSEESVVDKFLGLAVAKLRLTVAANRPAMPSAICDSHPI